MKSTFILLTFFLLLAHLDAWKEIRKECAPGCEERGGRW